MASFSQVPSATALIKDLPELWKESADKPHKLDMIRTLFEQQIDAIREQAKAQDIEPTSCFVSYNSAEKDIRPWLEERLIPDLRRAGVKVISALKTLPGGRVLTDFQEKVLETDRVILTCTPKSYEKVKRLKEKGIQSGYADEVSLAEHRFFKGPPKDIFPVVLKGDEETIPPYLRRLTYLTCHIDDSPVYYYKSALDLLIGPIRGVTSDEFGNTFRKKATQILSGDHWLSREEILKSQDVFLAYKQQTDQRNPTDDSQIVLTLECQNLPLIEDIHLQIKNISHHDPTKVLGHLDTYVTSLDVPLNTSIVQTVCELLILLLPHLVLTHERHVYRILNKICLSSELEKVKSQLCLELRQWYLSQRESTPIDKRVDRIYIPCLHYHLQSERIISSSSEMPPVLSMYIEDHIHPFFCLAIDEVMKQKNMEALATILQKLIHLKTAFPFTSIQQQTLFHPLIRKIESFFQKKDALTQPIAKNLVTGSKISNSTNHLVRHRQAIEEWQRTLQCPCSLKDVESATQSLAHFIRTTFVTDVLALNPFSPSYDCYLQGMFLPSKPVQLLYFIRKHDPSFPIFKDFLLLQVLATGQHACPPHLPSFVENSSFFSLHHNVVSVNETGTSCSYPFLSEILSSTQLMPLPHTQKDTAHTLQACLNRYTAHIHHSMAKENPFEIYENYLLPLEALLTALAHAKRFATPQNPTSLLGSLEECFMPDSFKLVSESLQNLYIMCFSCQLQKEESQKLFSSEEKEHLERALYLVLRPLILNLTRQSDNGELAPIDLLHTVIGSVYFLETKEEMQKALSLIPHIVFHLVASSASLDRHCQLYLQLSSKPLLEPHCEAYIRTLQEQGQYEIVEALGTIPNRSGFRQFQRLRKETLYSKLESLIVDPGAFSLPATIDVRIQGGPFSDLKTLQRSITSKLLDSKDNLDKSYKKGCAHNVYSLEEVGLHFKQLPSQPMMEYAIHTLTSRLVGEITPASSLLRFEVSRHFKTKKIYSVLVTNTIPGTNLRDKLEQDPHFCPDSYSLTKHLLASIITRPGDARSPNFIVTSENKLFCIDNDSAFAQDNPTKKWSLVEPVIRSGNNRIIQFCSILFCLDQKPLDKKAIAEFLAISPELIFNEWLDDLIETEMEYVSLFKDCSSSLYRKQESTPALLFPKGLISTLYAQCLNLQEFLKENQNKSLYPLDLLQAVITLNQDQEAQVGTMLQKRYQDAYTQASIPDKRLEKATGAFAANSTSTKQALKATHGRTPKAEEIEARELFSPQKAKEEWEAFFLHRSGDVQIRRSTSGIETLSVDFSHIRTHGKPDLEKEHIILKCLQKVLTSTTTHPESITLNQCHILTPDQLRPFLHSNLKALYLRDSSLQTLPDDLPTLCPSIETLYLSGSSALRFFPEGKFAHLKILNLAGCSKLKLIKIGAPCLEEIKVSKELQIFDIEDVNTQKLLVKGNLELELEVKYKAFTTFSWRRYFGDLEETPPLPMEIKDILNSPCPYNLGKKIQETCLLILIPRTVNGNLLTLNTLEKIIRNPQAKKFATSYNYFRSEVKNDLGNQSCQASYWLLISKNLIPGSQCQTFTQQNQLLKETDQVPRVLEVAVSILTHYVKTGEKLYPDEPTTVLTRCYEKVTNNKWRVVVGAFNNEGLHILCNNIDNDYDEFIGLSWCRKF